MIRWCVAYTHSGKENLAAGQLAAQGFKTYLPKYRKTVRHARRVRDIKAPLFPRYLFVAVDLDCNLWRAINGTRGISYILTMGEKPATVPTGIVEKSNRARPRNSLSNSIQTLSEPETVSKSLPAHFLAKLVTSFASTRINELSCCFSYWGESLRFVSKRKMSKPTLEVHGSSL